MGERAREEVRVRVRVRVTLSVWQEGGGCLEKDDWLKEGCRPGRLKKKGKPSRSGLGPIRPVQSVRWSIRYPAH